MLYSPLRADFSCKQRKDAGFNKADICHYYVVSWSNFAMLEAPAAQFRILSPISA